MTASSTTNADLLSNALRVLEENRIDGSTKPSPELYPHQWNWDSCFIALGLSRCDVDRAQTELLSLLRGQWSNGMIPQIVFNPEAKGYFPGSDTWQSRRSSLAPPGVETSGITQPPVIATSSLAICRRDPDANRAAAFARRMYGPLLAYHQFLYRERNPDRSGLIAVVHPWESGLDNSPPYLDAGSRVHLTYKPTYTRLDTTHVSGANRPTDKDYDLFVWLLEQMRAVDYDWSRYLPTAELLVEDVLFNSILCRANADLAELAELAGEDPSQAMEWRSQTAEAIETKLWDETAGLYFSFDRVAGRRLNQETVACLMPIYGLDMTDERAARLVEAVEDPERFWPEPGFPCPTTSLRSPWLNPENYWLGPVWINTNWLLIQGLEHHERSEIAGRLRTATLDLIRAEGFREYFNPFSGEGYGTDGFSWSAALTIDML